MQYEHKIFLFFSKIIKSLFALRQMKTNATIEYLAIIQIPKQQNFMIFRGSITKCKINKNQQDLYMIQTRFRINFEVNKERTVQQLNGIANGFFKIIGRLSQPDDETFQQ
ncbi:Hypothetical_protein [Hexamita inflata]|uniref:Hypothetical_protein n=1 Tax=Hexamita inflata TaxID=28002 RepID=A0AA86TSG8_9EUKA|nr:Hypothetical protein HINF_LOCUS14879 [Hexamita inflata]